MTTTALETLIAAVRTAQSRWAGLDWETDLTCGTLDDSYQHDAGEICAVHASCTGKEDDCRTARGTVPALRAAIDQERESVESDAAGASDLGDEAIEYATAGDWLRAVDCLRQASSIEQDYGDAPAWRPALEAAETLAEVLAVPAS